MADYKTMYLKLFNAVTDASKILAEAQAEMEQIYMETEPYTAELDVIDRVRNGEL